MQRMAASHDWQTWLKLTWRHSVLFWFALLPAEWAGYQPGKKSKGWWTDPHSDTAALSSPLRLSNLPIYVLRSTTFCNSGEYCTISLSTCLLEPLLILIILLNWFLQVPLRPNFWTGNVIIWNGMTFWVSNLLMNQHPFGWELSLTVVGLEARGFISVLNSKRGSSEHGVRIDFFPHWMLWACFWRRESFAVVWEHLTVIYLASLTWDFLADCACGSGPGWFWLSECCRN